MDFNFSERFEKLSGISHKAATEEEAAGIISAICSRKDGRSIALAGLAQSLKDLIKERCNPEITILEEPYNQSSLPSVLDGADIGITGISFAIAQSGTMVEISTNDATRLVSSLPDTYIGVLYAEDIVDHYYDGAALIRKIVSEHDRNLVISFISGPSRTGDIELKLTLGVHGPEEAHAIIIG
jgi:L-lactate dehydrogenase complex protein LldG